MDDLASLALAMITSPEDETPRAMYVDELMERTGLPRLECENKASDLWWPAREKMRMTRAWAYLEGSGPVALELQWQVYKAAGVKTLQTICIVITRGYVLPTRHMPSVWWLEMCRDDNDLAPVYLGSGQRVKSRPHRSFVVVGADWVLWRAAVQGVTGEPPSRYLPEEYSE